MKILVINTGSPYDLFDIRGGRVPPLKRGAGPHRVYLPGRYPGLHDLQELIMARECLEVVQKL